MEKLLTLRRGFAAEAIDPALARHLGAGVVVGGGGAELMGTVYIFHRKHRH